ncbi:3-phosphoshikimate 1-carboxyvinyltransferase [Deinococcus radiophilus]|uniref:3-phosphoshikimate 1-carboxyvinyltransferase n=1 Tax=Deinococcus radiophilus TaxID=32062 RepID=A0A3S0I625_9DEIO|nr:3-phosphoshikimate 1-carboxyvinyltransferase [Deinococcus radiophilus]RTR28316.1 3-phosphoshikimate 1-carboxyvinyltransferase [Deinococcus radiophilus]UFA51179.1 3-phosphoshikimate 1-carboxyvinyltransferase [Deinococcus radiophilus]
MSTLPTRFDVRVHPAARLGGTVQAQPSKNYTGRFLLAAALSEGRSVVRRVATSEDAEAMLRCLRAWGAEVELSGEDAHIQGFGAAPRPDTRLEVGNAGAVARFLLAVSALTDSTRLETDSPHSLGTRPMGDLLDALTALGLQVKSEGGCLPVQVGGGPIRGGAVSVSAERSSQFVSGLLFTAPLLEDGLDLSVTGQLKSEAPIRQTLDTLRRFGLTFSASDDLRRLQVPGAQAYQAGEYTVPGDYPGSAALLVAGAIRPGEVRVAGLDPQDLQGERAAVDVLRQMGADISQDAGGVTVRGGRPLRAVTLDGDPFTDAVQVLTAAAAQAQGCTTWQNVATLRLKECDRISETRAELLKLGLQAGETADSLSVCGGRLAGGVPLDGHGDHRLIMLLTLLGLCAEQPVTVTGAEYIRKSYPDFFSHLEALGAKFDYLARPH